MFAKAIERLEYQIAEAEFNNDKLSVKALKAELQRINQNAENFYADPMTQYNGF